MILITVVVLIILLLLVLLLITVIPAVSVAPAREARASSDGARVPAAPCSEGLRSTSESSSCFVGAETLAH